MTGSLNRPVSRTLGPPGSVDPAGESLRVLIVSPGYPPTPGGVERHVEAVGNALTERGHRVTVLALDSETHQPGNRSGGQRADGIDGPRVLRVPARTLGPFRLPRDVRGYLALLGDLAGQHDVLHVHNYHSPLPLIALRAVGADGPPIVLSPHFHGGGHSLAASAVHPLYRAAVGPVLPRAAATVCVSSAEARRFEAAFAGRLPAAGVVVVPNGSRSPAPRRPAGTGPALFVCVGRL